MPLLTLADAQLAYGELPLLDRAAFLMEAGERIGLIGRNGTGKSSLLGVIAGTAALDGGELRMRDGLRVAPVEQEPRLPHAPTLRASLLLRGHIPAIHDERERWRVEARLAEFLHRFGVDENLAPEAASGGETKRAALALAFALQPELLLLDEPTNHLDIDGIAQLEDALVKQPSAIVVTYDRAFLDRLLLARLFARPANVVVLDEPTNDLDIESLELLEAALQDYDGTLLLVSHDRAFLDNVVTQTLAAEDGGRWREYAGGYTDWLRQSSPPPGGGVEESSPPSRGKMAPAVSRAGERGRVKLNSKETRELAALPSEIEALEAEQHALAARMSAPDYYRQSPDILRADQGHSTEIEARLMARLERWEALEAKAKAAASQSKAQ